DHRMHADAGQRSSAQVPVDVSELPLPTMSLEQVVEAALAEGGTGTTDRTGRDAWRELYALSDASDEPENWRVRTIARAAAVLCRRQVIRDAPDNSPRYGEPGTIATGAEPGPADRAVLLRQILRALSSDSTILVPSVIVGDIDDQLRASSIDCLHLASG